VKDEVNMPKLKNAITKSEKFFVRLTPMEKGVLTMLAKINEQTESEVIRHIIRHYAKQYGHWPLLTCPECDSITHDSLGGMSYRCADCGIHFAST
jgi:hypothetical protein